MTTGCLKAPFGAGMETVGYALVLYVSHSMDLRKGVGNFAIR